MMLLYDRYIRSLPSSLPAEDLVAVSTIFLGEYLGSTDYNRSEGTSRQNHFFSIMSICYAEKAKIDENNERCSPEAEDHGSEQQIPLRISIDKGQKEEQEERENEGYSSPRWVGPGEELQGLFKKEEVPGREDMFRVGYRIGHLFEGI
jgi:hypothetical protein